MKLFLWVCSLTSFGASAWAEPRLVPPSAIWANTGEDKITQNELRATAAPQKNSVWDGSKITLFGSKNEILSFNLILEAGKSSAEKMDVQINELVHPSGFKIRNRGSGTLSELASSLDRPIELFFIRYLPIKGLSMLFYESYDERHIPRRLRRPYDDIGIGKGSWADRPDHDRFYPDIAAPIELHPQFSIAAPGNQSIWADIYIPKGAPAGTYSGKVKITQNKAVIREIDVSMDVLDITLQDRAAAQTMLYLGHPDIALRYTGTAWPNPGTAEERMTRVIRDRYFQMAHRHGVSVIDENKTEGNAKSDQPIEEWISRLNGKLFTESHGYSGPGENTGNGVFSIGTYGGWYWKTEGEATMHEKLSKWGRWFEKNSPETETFLYLVDESTNTSQIETWSHWVKTAPEVARRIRSFATIPLPSAIEKTPSLDIAASWFTVGDRTLWKSAFDAAKAQKKKVYFYNGKRPASGSFATEDDGTALRELVWGQMKHGIDRWFYWEGAYYNNFQGGQGQTNVFKNAHTYGGITGKDPLKGETGWNYSNGDGVLLYPGTDHVFEKESYHLQGPIASLRLKHWRRGLQDAKYIELARKKDANRVNALIRKMVPRSLWEYGIADPNDPTWVRAAVSWPEDSDRWEEARRELADIISGTRSSSRVALPDPVLNESLEPPELELDFKTRTKIKLKQIIKKTRSLMFEFSEWF